MITCQDHPPSRSSRRPRVPGRGANRLPRVARVCPGASHSRRRLKRAAEIAADVSKNGLGVLDTIGTDRRLAAADLDCPTTGDYYDRFLQAMTDHTGSNTAPLAPDTRPQHRYFLAQCVKDETMGESIAAAVRQAAGSRHRGSLQRFVSQRFQRGCGAERHAPAARTSHPGRLDHALLTISMP